MSPESSAPTTFGKYELLDRIAAGGMAEIFKARYAPAPGVTKQVVIKRILPHYAANKAFIGMFVNEARIAIGLSHGNIAQVFDFGEIEGDYFLAMELVDGPPLSKVVKRAKALGIHALPPEFAIFIAIEVLKGLHYAHTRNDEQGRPLKIVHRDVSPQNVLISFEGQIKLVDFGISRARNEGRDVAESKGLKGKYAYFAPEQAKNKDVDARTDVASAGTVLYEMLTGELPYQGTMYEVMANIAKGEFRRPRERNPDLSLELERVVLKAMALEKDDRFQTAEAFQHELSTLLAAHYPSFNSSHLSSLLQLLFEEELVREGRPVQLPPEFMQRVQGFQKSLAGGTTDDAGWVDDSDPEGQSTALTEMVNQGPDEDDHIKTSQLLMPSAESFIGDEVLAVKPGPSLPLKIAALGFVFALFGFVIVYAVVRLNHDPPPAPQIEALPPAPQLPPVVLEKSQPAPDLASAPSPDVPAVVTWPVTSFDIDPRRHHIDLEAVGAGSLPLEPKRMYAVALTRGATLGWGFYVVNPSGAQAGALGMRPLLITGTSRLYAYRIPTALLGSAAPEETKPRTLLVRVGRAKPKAYVVTPTLKLAPVSGVVLQGLDAKTLYSIVVRNKHPQAVSKKVSHVIIGHPTLGLVTTRVDVPVRINGATRLWFSIIDDPSAPNTEEPRVEIEALPLPKRR